MAISHAYLASIIESSDDAIIAKELDGTVTSWNRAAELILGYTAAEMIGQSIERIIPPDRRHEMREILGRIRDGERIRHFETVRRRKNGEDVHVSLSVSPILDAQGRVIGAAKILRDVEDRLATQARLLELEQRYENALHASAIGTWRIDLTRSTASRDAKACQLLGLPLNETSSTLEAHLANVHPNDRPRVLAAMAAAGATGAPYVEDYRVVLDGHPERCVRDRGRQDPAGPGLTGCLVDITEQAAVSRELAIEHARVRSILDRLHVGVVVVDLPSRRVALSNPAAERILGQGPLAPTIDEELSRRQADHLDGTPYQLADWPGMRTLTSGETILNEEITIRRPDGERRSILVTTGLIPGVNGQPVGLLASYDDITDRKQIEERYHLVFDSSPLPLWVYDNQTLRFLAVNQAAINDYGYTREQFLAMTVADIRPEDDVPHLMERIRQIENGAVEPDWNTTPGHIWRHRRKDGGIIHVEIRSHALRFLDRDARIVMAIDVTARLRLEEQLRQAQKMEAVGQLAGGIAHDFNNLLTVIGGYANLSLMSLPDDHKARPHLAQVVAASDRAAALTQQLLAFGRKQVLQPRLLNVNAVIDGMRPLLVRLLRENIHLDIRPDAGLPQVEADPHQLELVLMNLVINSADAMPGGGLVSIETREAVLDDDYARTHLGVAPGRHVLLAVSDTGHGMDQQTQGRIFEPFFTTKAPGKGTGLGLSTAFGIVKQSGGHIAVYSEVGVGTTFKVYLPVAGALARVAEQQPEVAMLGGSETILLVEDDPGVRGFAARCLRELGYTVHEAASGEQALRLGRGLSDTLDLLLTDVVMPNLGGRQLAETLAPLCRGMRVLFMSGYTENAIVQHGVLDPGIEYLPKPFNSRTLAERVRQVLATPRRPRAVLLLEGDTAVCAFLSDALSHDGYHSAVAATPEEVVSICRSRPVDLLVIDAIAPPDDTLHQIHLLARDLPHVRIAVIAGNWDDRIRREARRAGADECLQKPVALDYFLTTVGDLIG